MIKVQETQYRPYIGTWQDTRGVEPSVQRWIRLFRPNMRVMRLPTGWYGVCTPVLVLHPALSHGALGHCGVLLTEWIPNLYVPQATIPDERWIRAMLESRTEGYRQRFTEQERKERERLFKQVDEMAEADAKEAYPAFRELNRWNMSNVGRRNPYDEIKRKQDATGREQK